MNILINKKNRLAFFHFTIRGQNPRRRPRWPPNIEAQLFLEYRLQIYQTDVKKNIFFVILSVSILKNILKHLLSYFGKISQKMAGVNANF